VHGLFPHSRFQEAYDAVEAIFEQHREHSEALGVGTGYLLATVSTHCGVLEPVFFWPDELLELHTDAVDASHLKKLPRHAANPEALAHVQMLRAQVVALFTEMGAAHLQIGRTYNYREALKAGPAALVDALKKHLDPRSLMNPGSLGLK
jgi:FAD/FMN-containing dehydrogenase